MPNNKRVGRENRYRRVGEDLKPTFFDADVPDEEYRPTAPGISGVGSTPANPLNMSDIAHAHSLPAVQVPACLTLRQYLQIVEESKPD